MSIDEIREIVKTQITDPVPDILTRAFKLMAQDFETIGINSEGRPITKPISQMYEIGNYKTKLDAIMHMIEMTPLMFNDGQLKSLLQLQPCGQMFMKSTQSI